MKTQIRETTISKIKSKVNTVEEYCNELDSILFTHSEIETLDRYSDSIQSIRDAIHTIRENIEDSFTDFIDGKFQGTNVLEYDDDNIYDCEPLMKERR